MKKKIAILGSTGSIGTQALEVIEKNENLFELVVITANNNDKLLIYQAKKYRPDTVIIANKNKYENVKNSLKSLPIKVYAGRESIEQVVEISDVNIVLTAMVGFAGLLPTIKAINAKKDIALANKETLVVAGDLITELAYKNRVNILPVDSEHSAIFQCLVGENLNPIEKIYLTASGGPFRGKNIEYLKTVTKNEALKHPNWEMGAKITIDSASLMNKGLEAIEAKWLFDLSPNQIDIIVHPQSIIHSIVQFEDGSMKAQMGLPDMKLPIQYALSYPNRIKNDFKRFNFLDYKNLSFEEPNIEVFRNLKIAFEALNKGGNIPCIMNAANEVVVDAFLNEKISFLQIPEIIEKTIDKIDFVKKPSYDDYVEIDKQARILSNLLIDR